MGQYTEEQVQRINQIRDETPKEFQRRVNGDIEKAEKKKSLRERFSDYSLPDIIMWVGGIVPATGAAAYFGISALPGVSADTAQSLLDTANMVVPVVGASIIGVFGFKFGSRFVNSATAKKAVITAVTSQQKDGWTALYARRDSLVLEWSKYETDISLMIDYPIMTDYTDPEVRKVITAMQGIRKAEMMTPDRESTDPHTSAFQDAVDEFEVSFRAAEKYARRYGQTKLDLREQRKLSTARNALSIILDGSAPSYEIEAAYKSLRSSLKGIIDVPEEALLELESLVRREITVS